MAHSFCDFFDVKVVDDEEEKFGEVAKELQPCENTKVANRYVFASTEHGTCDDDV